MRNPKRKFVFSLVSLALISSVLFISTFERTQSGFSVFGKEFFAGNENGNFNIELYWSRDPDTEEWKNVENTGNEIPFGSDVKWEPDHTEVRYFKVKNAGDYDFNYNLGIDTPDVELDVFDYIAAHPIGNVIDVYLSRDITDLSSKEYIGTLSECFQTPNILNVTSADDLALEKGAGATYALSFTMKHSAGNEYQGTYDENNNRINNISFKICAGAYAEEPEPEYDGDFGIALPNYENYLYRIGNSNDVAASKLFYVNDTAASGSANPLAIIASAADFDSSLISFTNERIAGTDDVGFTFTPGTGTYDSAQAFLAAGKFRFKGNGVTKVTMFYNGTPKAELNLEVVNGKNVTAADTGFGTSNVIMLDNITTFGQGSLTRGRILYGNGFTLTSSRSDTSGTAGYLNINDGTLDNVILNGEVYTSAVTSGTGNQCYAPGVYISGDAKIYNSYISECKYAVSISSGNVLLKNTTVTGGALSNIYISGGNVTLENCSTAFSERGGLIGLAIRVVANSCKLNIKGTFNQYNWIQRSDLPSTYSTFVTDIYSNSTFAYTIGGKTYVNLGIMFLPDSGDLTSEVARNIVTDSTSNLYDYIQKSNLGITGTLYTARASMGSPEMLTYPGYSSSENGQYYTEPVCEFDYTTKNYKEKVADDNNFCYYDSTTDTVNISFDKLSDTSAFNWDPMIMKAKKYGSELNYTVSMNATDYTDSLISFADTGDYEVVYTYDDLKQFYYNSEAGLNDETVTYTQTVRIHVEAVELESVTYSAAFSYVSTWANSAKKIIVNNNTYVMPDVTATSSSIGSTTVGGQTVYYPIVTVGPTSSNGNTAYSSGKGYYFAPVFNAINITDYNQDTGAAQYTYNSSSDTWPHGKSATNGPDSAVFGYANGAAFRNQPYGRSMNSQYYKFGSNSNGLCYTSTEIEKNNTESEGAGTHLVQYHYVSNDGTTYYYYIEYNFLEMTYKGSTCFATGTQITMADGTQKPIEDVTFEDRILSYNFFTGKTEGKDIALLVNHGKDYYDVLNLEFSDGTVLRIIGDHGAFDYTLNKYVYLTADNYREYIGHKFVSLKGNGKFKKVKLVDAFVTNEYTSAFSITSSQNSNAFAENLLTVAPPDDFYNWIDMGGKMRYDKKQFDADVKKYGLYDYSVFKDYVSYDTFVAFNGPYLKVAVEKGKFTFDDIIGLINLYGSYMK